MSELEEEFNNLVDAIYEALAASVIKSNISLAQILNESVITGYDIPTSDFTIPIVMASKPCGRACLGMYMAKVGKIYFMDIQVTNGHMKKILNILDFGTDDIAASKWEDAIDEMHEWAQGNKEKIEIGY